MSIPSFGRLVRFVPKSGNDILIGEPTDKNVDVGAATLAGKDVEVSVFSGSSVLSPGSSTGKTEYVQHAREAKMTLPDVPVLFTKPSTALADPYPAPTVIPKHTLKDDSCDYESELVIVIGKKCKNVSEATALDYVLGYTASNDVSSRTSQFAQSQWSFSKGFDGACPIGPVLVSKELVPDVGKLHLRGLKNGKVMQDCGLDDLIFSVPKIVSFLSQGTTLNPGTIILTGTPAGVGFGFSPKEYLHEGDEFAVEILPYIGTLVTKFEAEK
ncbi:hypothetical protein ACEPPN_014039 [Leptodophora sp. 'Broadleaf-Isolate-01']